MIKKIKKALLVVSISVIVLMVAVFYYMFLFQNNNEIDESISVDLLNEHYGDVISQIISFYDVDDERLRQKLMDDLSDEIDKNHPLIFHVTQQDKGVKDSYGMNYFNYSRKQFDTWSTFTSFNTENRPKLTKGYIGFKDGEKLRILNYQIDVMKDEEQLEIDIDFDYYKLIGFMQNHD